VGRTKRLSYVCPQVAAGKGYGCIGRVRAGPRDGVPTLGRMYRNACRRHEPREGVSQQDDLDADK
jgi:hypothetical protein